MVFAEIIIRKTERNKNQSKQNEQGKTITQKTYKTGKKKEKKKKNKNKKKESLDGSVSLQIIKKLEQIKNKQTNKQSITRTATLNKQHESRRSKSHLVSSGVDSSEKDDMSCSNAGCQTNPYVTQR